MRKLFQIRHRLRRRNWFAQSTVTVLAFLFFIGLMPRSARSVPPRRDSPFKTIAFETTFERLAAEGKVCFVFEGTPLHAEIAAAEIDQKLNDANSFAERVGIVTNAFDYEPEHLNDHAYLLRKRYSTVEDLPCVTYGEMLAFVRGCNRIIRNFQLEDTMFTPNAALPRFAASLSKQQSVEIQDGNGVPISQFSEAQREMIRKSAVQYFAVLRFHSIENTLRGLEVLQSRYAYVKWVKFQNETLFGFEGPFGPNHMRLSFPLSGHWIQNPIGVILDTSKMRETVNGKIVSPLPPDPTAPTVIDYAEYSHPTRYNGATTFANSLNGIAAVDAALAEKPICIIGREYLPKSEMPLALSRLYRLLLVRQHDGSQRIAIREPRFSTSIARLPDDISRLVPYPLMRITKIEGDQRHYIPVVTNYYIPIVRKLRVRIQSRVPSPTSKPLPASEMTDEERRIFGLAFVTGQSLANIQSLLLGNVPQALTNPEGIYVRAQIGQNGEMLSIDIGHRDYKTGEFVFEVGGAMPKVYTF